MVTGTVVRSLADMMAHSGGEAAELMETQVEH
jgi:hypothetical protein